MSLTEDRKKFLNFIAPQRYEATVLVVKKEYDYKISSFDNFIKLPLPIGILHGSFYGQAFAEKYKSDKEFAKKFHIVTGSKQFVSMLDLNRISGFIGNYSRVSYQIECKEAYKGIKILPFQIDQSPFYFGISKKSVSSDLFNQLQEAYIKLQSRGLFDKTSH